MIGECRRERLPLHSSRTIELDCSTYNLLLQGPFIPLLHEVSLEQGDWLRIRAMSVLGTPSDPVGGEGHRCWT